MRENGTGVALARIAQGPLLYALETAKLRLVYLGFDLLQSDLPLRVAFPVMFHNIFEWFQPQRLEFPGQSVRAGAPFKIGAAQTDAAVEITTPSGKKEMLASGGSLVFADTLEAGFYAFKDRQRDGVRRESTRRSGIHHSPAADLTPAQRGKKTDTAARVERGWSLWPMLLGAVVLLLGAGILSWLYRQGLSIYPIAMRERRWRWRRSPVASSIRAGFERRAALDVVFGLLICSAQRGAGGNGKGARGPGGGGRREKRRHAHRAADFRRARRSGSSRRAATSRGGFLRPPGPRATDVQAALQGAASPRSAKAGREKLLLVSDGNENRGETRRVIPLLRAQGRAGVDAAREPRRAGATKCF